jgi:hypothetical protein
MIFRSFTGEVISLRPFEITLKIQLEFVRRNETENKIQPAVSDQAERPVPQNSQGANRTQPAQEVVPKEEVKPEKVAPQKEVEPEEESQEEAESEEQPQEEVQPEEQPQEEVQPAEEVVPQEEVQPAEEVVPQEEVQPAEEVVPQEEVQPAEEVQPTEEVVPQEEVQPTEEVVPPEEVQPEEIVPQEEQPQEEQPINEQAQNQTTTDQPNVVTSPEENQIEPQTQPGNQTTTQITPELVVQPESEQTPVAPANQTATNQTTDQEDLFQTFLYFKDPDNNVEYYYPGSALDRFNMKGNELEFFSALGGGPGIVKMVEAILGQLMKQDQLKAKFSEELHVVTKDLVDFFIVLINGDGQNFDQIKFAFDHIEFLKCVDFTEFIFITTNTARSLGLQEQYLSVIVERLDHVRDNFVQPS